MRCLGPLSACVIGSLTLTAGAGFFLGSLVCLAVGAGLDRQRLAAKI
ncbi:MAG TPA: hypothetical protein VFE34_25480 [Dongiaceae bacterium]|nr:hypothetical protein [Dongiaceae bacterium]